MSHRWKPIVACLSLILLATAGGCGNSAGTGDANKSPTTAIDGSGKETPSVDGNQSPTTPKSKADSQHPVVLIDTSLGKITVELDREKAMLTVDNFLSYVNSSFYDQSVIHQVWKGQGILGGGYGTNMLPIAKPTHQPIRNEADKKVSNSRGTIAMIRLPNAHGGGIIGIANIEMVEQPSHAHQR